ncbi:MAG: sulfite exporter TauE/SafE family protein, partial [Flavobacteriaceae bacterium]
FVIPALPEVLIAYKQFEVSKDLFIMLVFALIMLFSSVSMIRSKITKENEDKVVHNRSFWIVVEGTVVGFLTGLVGAGGGFLIIPALVLLAKLPMKQAVATSLLIITVKSLIGFLGDVQNSVIDWNFLLFFSALSVVGIFIGQFLGQRIKGERLKQLFGWFVLIMGGFILYKELIA